MMTQTEEINVWKILRALNALDKTIDDLADELKLSADDLTTILDALKVRFQSWP
jgi:uncharacterized protein (DUF433 family)